MVSGISTCLTSTLATFTPHQADGHHDNVLHFRIDVFERIFKMRERVVIAHCHQHIAWSHADRFLADGLAMLQLKAVELCQRQVELAQIAALGDCEDDEEDAREENAEDGGVFFREQVDDGNRDQKDRNQNQPQGNLAAWGITPPCFSLPTGREGFQRTLAAVREPGSPPSRAA